MKTRKKFNLILWTGVLIWVSENVYFGWNMVAQSNAERLADFVSNGLMFYGLIGSMVTSIVFGILEEIEEKE